MVAAGLTGVYAETIPNFEILTLVVFCSGVLLGARDGALVGAVTELVYSVLNPYGPAHPLVTLGQVAGIALAGAAGGAIAGVGVSRHSFPVRAVTLALTGAAITVVFDLLTNVMAGLVYGQMRAVLIGGIPFSLWHIGTNVALFALIGSPLLLVCARYRSRLSS